MLRPLLSFRTTRCFSSSSNNINLATRVATPEEVGVSITTTKTPVEEETTTTSNRTVMYSTKVAAEEASPEGEIKVDTNKEAATIRIEQMIAAMLAVDKLRQRKTSRLPSAKTSTWAHASMVPLALSLMETKI